MTIKMRRSAMLLLMTLLPFGMWAQTITVGGIDATDAEELEEAFGSTVTFSADDNTLTLNGATINGSETGGGCIISSLGDLTISIIGDNTIQTSDSCTAIRGIGGNQTLTIVAGGTNASLKFANRCIRDFYSINHTGLTWDGNYTYGAYTTEWGNGYALYISGASEVSGTGTPVNLTNAEQYDLWVNGRRVSAATAANVTNTNEPQVIFYAEQSKLSLNGLAATASTDYIKTNLSNLTVDIAGECSLELPMSNVVYAFTTDEGDSKITFTTSTPGTSALYISEVSQTAFSGFAENNIVFKNDLEGSLNDGTYTIEVPDTEYGISINMDTYGASITKKNRMNVDGDGKIQFDGKNTLILNGANIGGITIASTNTLPDEGLIVYLKGENTITNSTYAITSQDTRSLPLTFQTTDKNSGSLAYICQTCTLTVVKSAFDGFEEEKIKYNNGLVGKLDYTATEIIENHQNYTVNDPEYISQQTVTIKVTLPLVVDEVGNKTIDGDGAGLGNDVNDINDETTANISGGGVVRNNILYTFGDGDGSFVEDGKNYVNLTTNQDGAPADKQPGTREFAEAFKGATMLFPAGSHVMTIQYRNYDNAPNARLCVQIGQGASAIRQTLSFNTTPTSTDIPLVLTAPTHVFLFSGVLSAAPSRSYNDRRAPGRKETTTVGIGGLNINSSAVDATPEPALSPKYLDKSMMATWITGNHVTVNDADVEDLEDDAFDDLTGGVSPAPRRAIAPSFITYVDLTGTAIKNKEVDRTVAPFDKLNENTFIYMPAGNTVKAGTKNVVIGSVCDNMELSEEKQLEVAKDFTALDASLDRTFDTEKTGTIYLPFALNEAKATEMGKFYELTSYDGSTVSMTSVTATVANTPYMFKPAKTALTAKMVEVKKTAPASPTAGGITFVGTYASKSIVSDGSTQYYCFMADGEKAGKFVHVTGSSVTVSPYRAYMMKSGASARDLDVIIDGFATGVSVVKDVRSKMDGVFYDLSGRRVMYPTKGLYIVNGKKVIIK